MRHSAVDVQPSIQKLVASVINEALPHFTEEALQTQNLRVPLPAIDAELANLQRVLPNSVPDNALLQEATTKMVLSADGRDAAYAQMVCYGSVRGELAPTRILGDSRH